MNKIQSIASIGIQDVWDIEVADDHSYVAHGFLNHNSCSSPNLQNQPNDKKFRNCYVPSKGNKFVIADYSAQEPRILAHLSQDEKLIEIFESGKDLYISLAKEIFGIDITKKDPLRADIKALVLGVSYGMSEYGLAKKINKTEDEALEMINAFYAKFTGVKNWGDGQKRAKDFITTASGRKIWLNKYNSQWERNALNSPIQGTAGEMIKLAGSKFNEVWEEKESPIVLYVHDEIVLEVKEEYAEKAQALLKKVMEEVGRSLCGSVPFVSECVIADSWGEKG